MGEKWAQFDVTSVTIGQLSIMVIMRQGDLVVERSPSMRKVMGSIPGRVIPKTLKWYSVLLCLADSTKGKIEGK